MYICTKCGFKNDFTKVKKTFTCKKCKKIIDNILIYLMKKVLPV